MPRIAGVDIPGNKQIWVSLQHIYGIGSTLSQRILAQTSINPDTKTSNLTEEEVNRLRELIDREYRVEGELRKEINFDIKRLICRLGGSEREPMPAPSVVLVRQWLVEGRDAVWRRSNQIVK